MSKEQSDVDVKQTTRLARKYESSDDVDVASVDSSSVDEIAESDIDVESIADESEAGEIDQAALVRAAQSGDMIAWKQLVAIHAPRLAAYIGARLRRPEIVDRLVADSIYVAWKNLTELENEHDFPAWLRRMGGSVTMRWYKRHNDEGISGEFPMNRCDDPQLAQRIQALDVALGRLSKKERMALEQRYRAGLANDDIAEVLHKEPEQVEDLIQSGLQHLHKLRFQWDVEPSV